MKPRPFTGWAYPAEIAERYLTVVYPFAGEKGTIAVRVTPLPAPKNRRKSP